MKILTISQQVSNSGVKATTSLVLVLVFAMLLFAGTAFAGEITRLVWDNSANNTVQVHITGKSRYKLKKLADGKRLRVTFRKSTMGSGVGELGGRDFIKGVFPYIDGTSAVNLDVLTDIPAELKVEKTGYGYLVSTIADDPDAGSQRATRSDKATNLNNIEEIGYTTLPGGRVQVRLKMTKRPVAPKAFTITNPARIAFDFESTGITAQNTSVRVGVGALVSVKAIQADQRTRVVLNLVRSVGYKTSVVDNTLVFTLDSPPSVIAGASDSVMTSFSSGGVSGKHSLTNIDFRRGTHGDAKLIITLSDPSVGVDIKDQAGDIVLDFLDTSLPRELERRLDVVDFATPVQTIDVFTQGKNTRIVIAPTGKFEHLAYQAGTVFTLNVKPITEKEDEKQKDEFGYSGEKLSLNFQNIQTRAALQVLADFTGLNFVVSDTVGGDLTLRLKDVPWDQALDLILDAKGLAMRKKGNVVVVAPADEVAAKEKAAFEAAKVAVDLEPLVSELIQINYADADDIAKLLKSIKAITTGTGDHPVFGGSVAVTKDSTESNSLLSPRGQVTTDDRTNSILIQDTPGKIKEIRKLIVKLDQPVRQVMIESRLVEATDNFSKSLGAKFGVRGTTTSGAQQVTQGSSLTDAGNIFGADGLNVNLPTAGIGSAQAGTLALTIAKLGTGSLLSLELSALEQEGRGKIISSPRIVTANGQKAIIEQGQERVFTTSVLGVGTVVTKKAVLKLEVEPRITPDDRVIMDVKVAKDNFADALEGILNIKEIQTQVLLDNGETVVIGGIYELDNNTTDTKVPFFGDVPLLGWLFKNKVVVNSKTELLIFLTPRILSEIASSQ